MESSIDKTEKCCANCEGYNGECNNPESFQYGSMVSEDYCCHAFEFNAK